MLVHRVIHRQDPFAASREADAEGRRLHDADPGRLAFFVEREVLREDGTFPFGEGFLYRRDPRRRRDDAWTAGGGRPGRVFVAGHRGSKRQQQDAFAARRSHVSGRELAILVVADGVSDSGGRAKEAANHAVEAFLTRLPAELTEIPAGLDEERHGVVERALTRAAYASNFEVVRQALFGDGRYDASDRASLRKESDIDLPTGHLTHTTMQSLAPELDPVVSALAADDIHALTTFAVALCVDDDVYCFTTGDAVVGLYRPTEPEGERFLHLTHRDQAVVELFREDEPDLDEHEETFENVITDSFGDSTVLTGTLRRYPRLLRPGDRLLALSDGLGSRGGGRGLDRRGFETTLESISRRHSPARALVRAQLEQLEPGEYQDNIGVAVLVVLPSG